MTIFLSFEIFVGKMLEVFKSIGESFQDYSKIQDFEADFPKKVSLKNTELC